MSYSYSHDIVGKGTLFQWNVNDKKLIISVNSAVIVLDENDVKMLLNFLEYCEVEKKVMK